MAVIKPQFFSGLQQQLHNRAVDEMRAADAFAVAIAPEMIRQMSYNLHSTASNPAIAGARAIDMTLAARLTYEAATYLAAHREGLINEKVSEMSKDKGNEQPIDSTPAEPFPTASDAIDRSKAFTRTGRGFSEYLRRKNPDGG